ncbi:SDR family NAD(P)-dependent oxidoreductase [Mycolicibacterium sp. CBMA 226]|uniref:SDR family NAD(P)-dependent oxidoreductase n=1 Tax=Mycolicibacterium sp. CBMA 226 TaxID=2606611 RepID=UPI0012DF022A|nr:SDR family NAD(P)-dependent oxidoreductase [Mycolicibacterium sp. CBMA 226]MUL74840.1 SDR family NAD(P)-dependent oxidoreductase [Mycolicibacterium sp. CBMA 226]
MNTTAPGAFGTVLITGPTGGLGKAATLAMARRPEGLRPDLLLVGRPGQALTEVTAEARAAGANVHAVTCDLAQLDDVRRAGKRIRELLDAGTVGPLRVLVANAGISVADTHGTSADGYESTFAVNYLAHAQLIGDLLDQFTVPARVVLLGSNTYHQNIFRRILGVAPAHWRDPIELARPTPADQQSTFTTAGTAYSNSKLALMYYAHELQRRAPAGINVVVFEPGFMPGTGLSRDHGPGAQRVGQLLERIPGVSSPTRSGPLLASIALDDRWAHLRGGAFVVKDKERAVKPFANDPAREARLWDATAELLSSALGSSRTGRSTLPPPH